MPSRRSPHARPSALRLVRALVALAALAPAPACSEDYGNEPLGSECGSDVELSITAGDTPTFSWTPTCRVSALLVQRSSDLANLWYIQPAGALGIEPGVVYGVVPSGATQDAPAEPLDTGVSYRVLVARGHGGAQVVAGSKSFTP